MRRQFKILNADGSINPDMTKDIHVFATELNGAVAAFLEKRNALKEVDTPDESSAKFINEDTNEEFLLVPDEGDFL